MSVEITNLIAGDVDQFVELLRAGFGDELGQRGTNIAGIGRLVRVMSAAGGLPLRLIKATTGRGLYTLVAKDGPRLVGILTVIEGREPILIGVYVVREYRRQGIAPSLVDEALRRLKESGYSHVKVSVYDRPGQLLAEQAGFVVCDHMDLYQRSIPRSVSGTSISSARHVRKGNLARHPYDLGPLNLLTRVHINRLLVYSDDEETIEGMLISLPHQKVGEIRSRILVPGREDTFRALLEAGYEWLSRLGCNAVSVPLYDDTAGLSTILEEEGFSKRHSWVEMRRAL